MSTAAELDLQDAEEVIEIRRRGWVSALIGAAAAALAIAYLMRVIDGGGLSDQLVCALLALIAAGHLTAFIDASTPVLVADHQGVRLRVGRSWTGLPWHEIASVDVISSGSLLRDARLSVVPLDVEGSLAELPAAARRRAALMERMYGAPFALPLTPFVRVDGAGESLQETLDELAAGRTHAEPEAAPAPARFPDPRPALAQVIGKVAGRIGRTSPTAIDADSGAGSGTGSQTGDIELLPVASATPSPLRDPVTSRRADVSHEIVAGANALELATDTSTIQLPELAELRRGDVDDLDGDWSEQTVVVEDFPVAPAPEPVIGPAFADARAFLGLDIDSLAERTRIRPHVLEAIEYDDFAPCGGDFYARGHIRTLARVLGVDVDPLLASYDELYADAPVDARRVFEAELASNGRGIRRTQGGPNWSVLVAACMALVLVWSIARLVMDGPVAVNDGISLSNGSGGPNGQVAPPAAAVPVVITAPKSGARVIVRDSAGTVVFNGPIAFGASKTLDVSPPVRIQSSDGSVTVSVDGQDRGALGVQGSPGSATFVVR